MMDRRAFLGSLAAGVLITPQRAEAQPPGKIVRLGVLRPAPDDPVFRQNFEPFRQTLREKGFQEGTNLVIEYRVRAGSLEEITALARELVQLKVDAILAIAPVAVRAAARATTSIPVVAVDLETDPIAAGLATSLARPGRNITGLFLDFPELSGKWIELLKTAMPTLTRIAVLWDPATGPSFVRAAETAAQALRVQLLTLEARRPADFAEAFRAAAAGKAGAMLVLSSPVFNSARREIVDLTAKHRIPAIMPFTGFAEDGGLMSYGPHVGGMFGQAAEVMANVLRGARVGDIPVVRPTRFQLTFNLRTARTLGITVPPSLLIRADQVLE
jgi:putative ABC transport system substrate-binding protein